MKHLSSMFPAPQSPLQQFLIHPFTYTLTPIGLLPYRALPTPLTVTQGELGATVVYSVERVVQGPKGWWF